MKKRILLGFTAAIVSIFTSISYASNKIDIVDNVSTSVFIELQKALLDSNVLRGTKNVVTKDNENTLSNVKIQQSEVDETSLARDAIKVYCVDLDSNINSLSEILNKENELWIIPEKNENGISYIFVEKGQDFEQIEKKIGKLNISNEIKMNMLRQAKEREGKWYVSRVEEQHSIDEATAFVSSANIKNKINNDIKSIKYVYITNRNLLAVWVETDSNEFVIPYNNNCEYNSLINNHLYSLSDIKECVTADIVE